MKCPVCKKANLVETEESIYSRDFYDRMISEVYRDAPKLHGMMKEKALKEIEYEPCKVCKEIESKRRLKMLRLWGQ